MSQTVRHRPATRPPTAREELDAAIEVLERYGTAGFSDPESVSRGKAIGYALFAGLDLHTIFEAAVEALEGWNAHLLVAVLVAAHRGRWGDHRGNPPDGSITRRGRHVRIELPQWWAD